MLKLLKMNEFKGTKGKWHFEYPGGNTLARLFNEDGEEILNFGNDYDYYPTEGLEPNDHDALLISKAPEMLEALIKVNNFISENKDRNYMIELLSREVPELSDLITRATTIQNEN